MMDEEVIQMLMECKLHGLLQIEFMNGVVATLNIKRAIYSSMGEPVYLETESGVVYPYRNVLSLKKAE